MAAALASVFIAGCVPVVWLPDSSGFIYTTGKHYEILMHYDVASGQRRQIARTQGSSPTPALSPDGRQVAVASLTRGDDGNTLCAEIFIYDLKGREVHRSKKFEWGPLREDPPPAPSTPREAPEQAPVSVAWAGDRIAVVFLSRPRSTVKTCLYEPANGKATMVSGMGVLIAGSPFRPDGKGMLLVRAGEIVWLDNRGGESRFPIHKDVLRDSEKVQILMTSWRGSSFWKDHTAVISYGRFRMEIDTGRRVMNCTAIPDSEALTGGKLIEQQFSFGPGEAIVRVVREDTAEKHPPHLQVIRPGAAPVEPMTTSDGFMLCPSPDGKWLLARDMTDSAEHDDMVLIDRKGAMTPINDRVGAATAAGPSPQHVTGTPPPARSNHTTVWTGSEMIVWGGQGDGGRALNTGGRYNPESNSWVAVNPIGAPAARGQHTAVWTGKEMIVWGGEVGGSAGNTGGRYNPKGNSWMALSATVER